MAQNISSRAIFNQIQAYEKERLQHPWLPRMLIFDDRRFIFLFEIPLLDDLQVHIELSEQYPFRPPVILLSPNLAKLVNCCHNNSFGGFDDCWTPAMTLSAQIITLYSYIIDPRVSYNT